METKFFEVRDEGTLIPIVAMRPTFDDAVEATYWEAMGYGRGHPYVIVMRFHPGMATYNDSDWTGMYRRTMGTAHRFIKTHWSDLTSGDVIDVEYLLGDTAEPKASDLLPAGMRS